MNEAPTPLLRVRGLTMRFGGLLAVCEVDLDAEAGAITAVIGPNGAGKTTLFNCVTGFYRPGGGEIRLAGRRLDGLPGHRIARAGVARTFQNIRLFPRMTVLENLLVGAAIAERRSGPGRALARARQWLAETGLEPVADREAGTLPYGTQRTVEIARALCTNPRLLCLDEPAAGLNPRETEALGALLLRIRTLGAGALALLLIEHDMGLVMGISDRVYVLEYGRRIAVGPPAAVRRDPAVIRAYLGEPEDGEAAA